MDLCLHLNQTSNGGSKSTIPFIKKSMIEWHNNPWDLQPDNATVPPLCQSICPSNFCGVVIFKKVINWFTSFPNNKETSKILLAPYALCKKFSSPKPLDNLLGLHQWNGTNLITEGHMTGGHYPKHNIKGVVTGPQCCCGLAGASENRLLPSPLSNHLESLSKIVMLAIES